MKRLWLALRVFYTTLRYGFPVLPFRLLEEQKQEQTPYEVRWRLARQEVVIAYKGKDNRKCRLAFERGCTHEDVHGACLVRDGRLRQCWPEGAQWQL